MTSQRITPTACLIVIGLATLAACGGGATATPAAATATPLPAATTPAPPTSALATSTSVPPTATSAPQATPTLAGESVTFEFVKALSTIEELEDISLLLHDVEGILGIEGDETSITILYDPEVITEDELQQTMDSIGYPVKPPG